VTNLRSSAFVFGQQSRCGHLRFLTVLLATIGACTGREPATRDTSTASDTSTAPAESQVAWTVRPLLNAPNYFVLSGWATNDTVWGLAGDNPVDVHVISGAGRAWGVRASGAHRSADRRTLAWADPTGIWTMRRGGRVRRILRFASLPSPPPGDPTFEIRWAPNGLRVLTSWRDEGNVTWALVDTASGGYEPLPLRVQGYGELGAPLWLDDRRILFSARANSGKDGSTGYREGGWRADLVLFDRATHQLDRVTSVPDGVFLEPLGAWSDTVLAIRRSIGDSLATFSLFDSRAWSETNAPLPRGTGAAVNTNGSSVAVFRSDDIFSQVLIRARRASVPHAAPVLIPGRITGAAWSPDGRSLAVSTMADEPVEGSPNDRRTVYRLSVVQSP